jgi:hypothetical protein
MMHHEMPLQHLLSNDMQRTSMGAAKALFCRNIMDACKPMEHGGDSKRKHLVEAAVMQQKSGRERLEGATPWSTWSQSNNASMSALEKNRARIGKSLIQLFVRVL